MRNWGIEGGKEKGGRWEKMGGVWEDWEERGEDDEDRKKDEEEWERIEKEKGGMMEGKSDGEKKDELTEKKRRVDGCGKQREEAWRLRWWETRMG